MSKSPLVSTSAIFFVTSVKSMNGSLILSGIMFCFCQYFANSISRLLLPVDGAHAASCEEMATAMSSAEGAAYKGLQQCIETVMAEVCHSEVQ